MADEGYLVEDTVKCNECGSRNLNRDETRGEVVCEDCGGMRTPGNIGTVQQSLGGVVRAVPGVMRVDFDLSYGSD